MLPSTGLFKSIICPHYERGGCSRPYCHFKHAKKDDENEHSKPPPYNPTQQLVAPTLLTLGEPISKKPKLEYIPTKPAINDAVTKFDLMPSQIDAPLYIPSNSLKNDDRKILDFDLDDCTQELDDLVSLVDDAEPNTGKKLSVNPSEDEQKKFEAKLSEEDQSNEKARERKNSVRENFNEKTSHSSSRRHKDEKSSRSRSSSARRDSESSSKQKERKSSHKSSHSSQKSHTSSKSSSSRKDRKESSDSSRRSHKSSSKHKRDRHKSSSSSSQSKTKSTSANHTSGDKLKPERSHSKDDGLNKKRTEEIDFALPSPSSVLCSSSDEDAIMEQCKMIFAEYKPANTSNNNNETNNSKSEQNDTEDTLSLEAQMKKRVAHEKAANAKPASIVAPRKPNHIRNAMQSIYQRQEMIRKQQEEAVAAAAEKKAKEAEEKLKKEAAQAASKPSSSNLTPLVPRSYLTPSRPSVTPSKSLAMASASALERAKKKIEMLKAEKCRTPCQTAPKVGTRVAHKVEAPKESKPAPPVLEANSTKISFNIRTQYYNIMVKHCLDIYPSCEDAWERAQTEELAVFKKCNTPVIYKSSALLAINKLRKESIDSGNIGTDKNKTVSHEVILAGKLAQNTSWSVNKKLKSDANPNSSDPFMTLPGEKVYEMVHELRLTDEQLESNGFPRPGRRPGIAVISTHRSVKPPSENERYCSRCSKLFNLSMYDEIAVDECNYHPKSTGYRRGFADNSHRCCQQPAGSLGCTYGNYHVSDYCDYGNLTGFVTTIERGEKYIPTRKDIYALDCEMCYTTHGLELTRVTVVDINSKKVYDALIKPDNKIIDYNTTYSGITEQMLAPETRNLRDVQAILLSMFHSKTILVGHSLESDMKALKMIHSVVVDTSVLFPHKLGPPKKRALKTLCIENLKRIIQENEGGHDSAEDAEACIALVKYYLRNRIL